MNINNKILALLLINKGGIFANSHQLTKILEWKFKIMDSLEIYNSIRNEQLVTFKIEDNTTYSYELTQSGKEIMEFNKGKVIELFKRKFPNELSILDNL